jgi:hypothetical protein
MIEIGNTIVSFDVVEKNFICDTSICKGACCIHGDSGAPLEADEAKLLEKLFPEIVQYMQPGGIKSVEKLGVAVVDSDGDLVTPLIDGKECAFTYFDDGIAKCAIEKAWMGKNIDFRKPISCWLYPIRVTKYTGFEAVNYHLWEICKCAIAKGNLLKIPIYVFLKEPLEFKFGKEWYNELKIAAAQYLEEIGRNTE